LARITNNDNDDNNDFNTFVDNDQRDIDVHNNHQFPDINIDRSRGGLILCELFDLDLRKLCDPDILAI